MSNLETLPVETTCQSLPGPVSGVEVLPPREVPLGGPRAMTVRRTLPSRQRSLIGAWCFLDHYGPADIATGRGMDVPPHPHTGLQTVTWLFAGDVEHRDSVGSVQQIRPGQLNLMTAGHGIAHSEVSLPGTRIMHGVQLWVALPDAHRRTTPSFEHHADLPTVDLPDAAGGAGGCAVVIIGELVGERSPATAFSPIVGAEIQVLPGACLDLPVEPGFEHGVLVDEGEVAVQGAAASPGSVAYVASGRDRIEVRALGGAPARVMLLGGAPFGEDILMWWNFVGRTHEEVVAAREEWQAGLAEWSGGGGERFGRVEEYPGSPLPAPELPHVRLQPRSKRESG